MFKFLPRSLITAQSSSVGFCETRILLTNVDKNVAAAFQFANQSARRAFGTSLVRLCDKQKSSDLEEKQNAHNQPDTMKAPVETDQPTLNASKVTANQNVDLKNSETVDGSVTQQGDVVKVAQLKVTPEEVKTDVAKSEKQSLLDLLGAMKVEVTNKKRKLPNIRFKQSHQPVSKSKPPMDSTIDMFQQAAVGPSTQREKLDPELVAAASAVARTLPHRSQAESELLKKLRQHETVTEAQRKGDLSNLGVIIADMKVGKMSKRKNARAANQIRFDDDGEGYRYDRDLMSDGVWGKRSQLKGKRLNIFPAATDGEKIESAVARPTLWDVDFANQLSSVTNQMPRNGLEEMIKWTKEGKMWRYPINNEDGLEEEASVSFHEHVFLTKHLEEGFPRQGPIRHFMELVVAGLSKNPFLTVQQKKEHIFWFRDYFHQKADVLKEAEVYLN